MSSPYKEFLVWDPPVSPQAPIVPALSAWKSVLGTVISHCPKQAGLVVLVRRKLLFMESRTERRRALELPRLSNTNTRVSGSFSYYSILLPNIMSVSVSRNWESRSIRPHLCMLLRSGRKRQKLLFSLSTRIRRYSGSGL